MAALDRTCETLGMTPVSRFIVVQVGARMHYAVPTLLARAGMLDRFYTDIHAGDFPLSVGLRLIPEFAQTKAFRRLSGRRIPREILPEQIRSVPFQSLLNRNRPEIVDSDLLQLARKDGFGSATGLYTLSTALFPLSREAREHGLKVTYEQTCHPCIGRTYYEERLNYPGVERQVSLDEIESGIQADIAQWRGSDIVIAPSQYVKDGIYALSGIENRVQVVPYGIPENWLALTTSPVAGSILCVGRLGLPKGTHYLAAATRILKSRRVPCQVTAIGSGRRAVIENPIFSGPKYLDSVPRTEITRFFQSADVFVLPTLSESFGLVHLEALACGVPVITTPNCGSVVRDGIDGFIVPPRDAEALADRIEMIVTDRYLRDEMSKNARKRAEDFTWTRYGERLLSAVSKMMPHEEAGIHV